MDKKVLQEKRDLIISAFSVKIYICLKYKILEAGNR